MTESENGSFSIFAWATVPVESSDLCGGAGAGRGAEDVGGEVIADG